MQAVDTAFASVIEALRSKLMIENSVVIFTSTSGGPAAGQHNFNAASNFPYRYVSVCCETYAMVLIPKFNHYNDQRRDECLRDKRL